MTIESADQAASAAEAAGAAYAVGWKLAGLVSGFGFAAGLGAFIAMCMMRPRDDREWRVALASCLATSVFGGAAFIRYFGLMSWAGDMFGIVGLAGVFVLFALPGWSLVRWLFNYLNKNKDKDIVEMQEELRRRVAGVKVISDQIDDRTTEQP